MTINSVQLASTSYFTKGTALIRLVEYNNPEIYFVPLIQDYFQNQIGQQSLWPNFKTLRVGSVHPFALILAQDVFGQKLDADLFPSITVSDSDDAEGNDELARGYSELVYGQNEIAQLANAVQLGQIITSAPNMNALKLAAANGGQIVGKMTRYRANHSVNMNIWGDNRDIVSLIYDLLKHFIIGNINTFHLGGIDVMAPISGRRTGDINLEFSQLLFGANITVPCTIETANMVFEVPIEVLAAVDSNPTFFVGH